MNGIEKISARLIGDAQQEIDILKAETDERCAAILGEYEAAAAEAYSQRMARGRALCSQQRERMEASADMEMRKALLAFKQELVSEAFAKAIEAIANLPEDEYIEFLAAMMAKAANSGEEEVLLSAEDSERVGAKAVRRANALIKERGGRGTLSLADETADIPSGFIMRSGNIEINCAGDALVMMQRSALASQVAEILFS
ncbi:MAG: hypothetical protein IKV79_02215 [Oscillospiraceae bacterium]|nr:hypothetical protein [Oscillospiraceae bacterium]